MIKDERVLELIEIIKKKKRIAVKELAEITFSSTSTLRRDLIFLENQGLIKRKHGYVTLSSMNTIEPQLFTPNLKTIQNPCLSLDPGWFLFSPNGCFLLDK
ncbi:DeoR family transcriptional regulator, partial [Streptococcus pneumoniae]|nr:DeoR family transcriptional regulator [Streptococcus pneumoniae]